MSMILNVQFPFKISVFYLWYSGKLNVIKIKRGFFPSGRLMLWNFAILSLFWILANNKMCFIQITFKDPSDVIVYLH